MFLYSEFLLIALFVFGGRAVGEWRQIALLGRKLWVRSSDGEGGGGRRFSGGVGGGEGAG